MTETIYSGIFTINYDFSLKWWQFKRRYKRWKTKRWEKNNPHIAAIIEDKMRDMAHQIHTFLAYGDKQ